MAAGEGAQGTVVTWEWSTDAPLQGINGDGVDALGNEWMGTALVTVSAEGQPGVVTQVTVDGSQDRSSKGPHDDFVLLTRYFQHQPGVLRADSDMNPQGESRQLRMPYVDMRPDAHGDPARRETVGRMIAWLGSLTDAAQFDAQVGVDVRR